METLRDEVVITGPASGIGRADGSESGAFEGIRDAALQRFGRIHRQLRRLADDGLPEDIPVTEWQHD